MKVTAAIILSEPGVLDDIMSFFTKFDCDELITSVTKQLRARDKASLELS